ncbi:phospho-sugar mutase [Myroides pelagicus]|uniref:Phospho-sugar mutase n=1 Tax=Myroides pelagicus TaxID=270914 RepID=A0A7K1GLT1_9FLAO|nr:phospho-sugar mutase [Myroides pelagicus]MEC4114325.1 phospho-sugar mutase [Myroides pelagicus]MTH29852.1 phospho-sugar mutase [Myroides pelagicus]
MQIEKEILEKAEQWLKAPFDSETQATVKKLIESDPNQLKDSFYKNLEFGTGGMRGIMGTGTNRINKYTLGKNTQGLANYIKTSFPNQEWKVAINYDCRHNSQELARVVADVFTANGIKVYLFSEMRPTPELSFAVRHYGCNAGIVLTASHNPPEYNGYKVYWQDGGQIVPPNDGAVIDEINKLTYDQINFDGNDAILTFVGEELDQAFIQSTIENASFNIPQNVKDGLKIAYTSLHGTSIKLIPKTLEAAGYKNVYIVKEQEEPNGDFPTVKSPNPEEPEALTMAIALADEKDADIVIGTDPDSDRIGIGVRDLDGKIKLLNGNQTMVMMTAFLLEQWKQKKGFKGHEFVGSTIVSTPMMLDVAESYGVECKVGLTGFKWIAKFINDCADQKFIGGGEESFGYMVGDAVRDKDAVASTLLVCEIAAIAKAAGSSFYKELINLYIDHHFYKEHLISLVKKGISGAEEIKQMMINLRQNPLTEIIGQRVVCVEDYQSSEAKNLITGEVDSISVPKSNVLIYYLEDGTKIAARPSGTEPKIKFYFSVNEPLESIDKFKDTEHLLDQKIQAIIKEMQLN